MRCLCLFAVTTAIVVSSSVALAQPSESVVATDSALAARLADARQQLLTKDHPLVPVLRYAYEGYDRIDRDVHDYTCLLIKRERVDGKLGPYQHIEAKIRHSRSTENGDVPFAVFLRFLGPAEWKEREVLFVDGQNNGDLIARRGGKRSPNMTLRLEPTSPLAMDGNRYPITEIGIQNLIARLIEVGEQEIQYPECEVKFFDDAQLNGRSCTHIQVTHTEKRDHFRYHQARIFIDEELKVPVYYASYDWPREEGGPLRLLEEYAYTNIKLNVGLSDTDFDPRHPDYNFRLDD